MVFLTISLQFFYRLSSTNLTWSNLEYFFPDVKVMEFQTYAETKTNSYFYKKHYFLASLCQNLNPRFFQVLQVEWPPWLKKDVTFNPILEGILWGCSQKFCPPARPFPKSLMCILQQINLAQRFKGFTN